MGRHGLDCSGLVEGRVVAACKSKDELSSSMKSGEFLVQMKTCWLLTKTSAACSEVSQAVGWLVG